MQLSKLNVPKKINVGFQNRQDTYTGKLAFVVYTDEKGVLRKEKSWNGWRDKKIEPQEFDNVPTSGFVLNKKVGETRYGWNPRMAWVRCYDPRGFEFEVSVANLIFILEECSSIKGKGLEGEFVYAWDGPELVLLPAGSQEYKQSCEFTNLQTKKLTKDDVKVGCLYTNKDNQTVMYLGRLNFYRLGHHSVERGHLKERYATLDAKKQHVFVSTDGKSTYWTQDGFTKLAARLSDEPAASFAEEFEKFMKSPFGSALAGSVEKQIKPTRKFFKRFYHFYGYVRREDGLHEVQLSNGYSRDDKFSLYESSLPAGKLTTSEGFTGVLTSIYYTFSPLKWLSYAEVKALDLVMLKLKNEGGGEIRLGYYDYDVPVISQESDSEGDEDE